MTPDPSRPAARALQRATKSGRNSRRVITLLAIALALSLIVVLANATFVLLYGASRVNRYETVGGAPAGWGQPVNILVFGTHSGASAGGLGDAAMVLHVPARGSEVFQISLPRHGIVDIPGAGPQPFAEALKDADTTRSVVEGTLGVTINHVVTIDLNGLANLTDALGGINVTNPTAMHLYRQGLNWPAGEIRLTGSDVLWFVTLRADSSLEADADRATRQRHVMLGIADELRDPRWLVNPFRGMAVMDALGPAVTVDASLTPGRLAQVALSHPGLVRPRVHTAALPVRNDGTIDPVVATELGSAMADDAVADYVASHTEVGG